MNILSCFIDYSLLLALNMVKIGNINELYSISTDHVFIDLKIYTMPLNLIQT